MEVKKESLPGNKVKLEVELEAEKVNEALEKAYRKVVKDVSIPGFRKGKVPRKVLEARYGKEILHKDALDILIPEGYSRAVEESGIEPVDQPDIEDFYLSEDEPATFEAIVEVKPEVELGEYTGLGVEKEESPVTEEEVQQRLEEMQDKFSQLVATDYEEIEDGDFVIIDYEGTIDGEPFEGGSQEEFSLEIGSGTFVPGFEDKLIGKKVGEKTKINITFPEDYRAQDLAGKDVVFEVDIKEIKRKEVPELDDEFAREASDFDSLEDLKENIRENIKTQKEEKAEAEFKEKIIEKVTEKAEVDVSDTLITQELDRLYNKTAFSMYQQGLEMDQYLEYMGMDEDGWRDQNRDSAERMVRQNLVLEEIARKEGIEVADEEVDERIEKMAKESDQDLEQVKAIMQAQGEMSNLKETIKMQKTIDFLVDNNKV